MNQTKRTMYIIDGMLLDAHTIVTDKKLKNEMKQKKKKKKKKKKKRKQISAQIKYKEEEDIPLSDFMKNTHTDKNFLREASKYWICWA